MSNVSARADRIVGLTEVKEKPRDLVKALFAEYIGTLFLVLVGCGSCVKFSESVDLVKISLAVGVIVATMVLCIGHVSGGHINPAVTCGMLVAGKISLLKAFLYIVVQSLGAITGSGILKGLTPAGLNEKNLGEAKLNSAAEVDVVQGLGVEFFITFVLVLTVFAVCDENRKDLKGSAPLAIGLAVAACHFFAIDYTGSAMNPARAIGPAVVVGEWEDHWIYWLGPCVGGMTAGILYQSLFSAAPSEAKDNCYLMHLKAQDGDKEGASKGLMPGDTCC